MRHFRFLKRYYNSPYMCYTFTLLGRNYFASYGHPVACYQSLAAKLGASKEFPSSLDNAIYNKFLTALLFICKYTLFLTYFVFKNGWVEKYPCRPEQSFLLNVRLSIICFAKKSGYVASHQVLTNDLIQGLLQNLSPTGLDLRGQPSKLEYTPNPVLFNADQESPYQERSHSSQMILMALYNRHGAHKAQY